MPPVEINLPCYPTAGQTGSFVPLSGCAQGFTVAASAWSRAVAMLLRSITSRVEWLFGGLETSAAVAR